MSDVLARVAREIMREILDDLGSAKCDPPVVYLPPDVARDLGAEVPEAAELVVIHDGELRWL